MFAASQFSSVLVRQGREVLLVRDRHSAVLAISAVVRIPPVQLAPASRLALEWAEHRDCRLRECPPNRPDVRVRLRAVRDSAINMGPKKGR